MKITVPWFPSLCKSSAAKYKLMNIAKPTPIAPKTVPMMFESNSKFKFEYEKVVPKVIDAATVPGPQVIGKVRG